MRARVRALGAGTLETGAPWPGCRARWAAACTPGRGRPPGRSAHALRALAPGAALLCRLLLLDVAVGLPACAAASWGPAFGAASVLRQLPGRSWSFPRDERAQAAPCIPAALSGRTRCLAGSQLVREEPAGCPLSRGWQFPAGGRPEEGCSGQSVPTTLCRSSFSACGLCVETFQTAVSECGGRVGAGEGAATSWSLPNGLLEVSSQSHSSFF